MLTYTITNEADIPEGLAQFYSKHEDGSFRLQVAGVVSEAEHKSVKDKNKELRQNNTDMLKTNEVASTLKELVGINNINPDAVHSKIEELAKARADLLAQAAIQEREIRIKELEEGNSKRGKKLNQLLLSQEIQRAGTKHGVVQTGYDDVLRRAEADFQVTDDGAIAFKHERNDATGKPYTVDSWMSEQQKAAPHLFTTAQGTNAFRPAKGGTPTNNSGDISAIERIERGLNSLSGGNVRRLN